MAEGRCRKFCLPSQIPPVVTTFFSVVFLSTIWAKTFVCSSCAVVLEKTPTELPSFPLSDLFLDSDLLSFTSCLSIFIFSQQKTALKFCFMFYSTLYIDSTPRYYDEIKQCIHITEMNHQPKSTTNAQRMLVFTAILSAISTCKSWFASTATSCNISTSKLVVGKGFMSMSTYKAKTNIRQGMSEIYVLCVM